MTPRPHIRSRRWLRPSEPLPASLARPHLPWEGPRGGGPWGEDPLGEGPLGVAAPIAGAWSRGRSTVDHRSAAFNFPLLRLLLLLDHIAQSAVPSILAVPAIVPAVPAVPVVPAIVPAIAHAIAAVDAILAILVILVILIMAAAVASTASVAAVAIGENSPGLARIAKHWRRQRRTVCARRPRLLTPGGLWRPRRPLRRDELHAAAGPRRALPAAARRRHSDRKISGSNGGKTTV